MYQLLDVCVISSRKVSNKQVSKKNEHPLAQKSLQFLTLGSLRLLTAAPPTRLGLIGCFLHIYLKAYKALASVLSKGS